MPLAVILTALPVEYLAVRKHLTALREEMHPQGTIYERGQFVTGSQQWEVGIAEVGAGNAGAAVEAERALNYFKPDVLFFVGIAGGIKDVAIGDVVAATKVYGYESGKVGEDGFATRPALGQATYAVIQRAKSEARKGEWVGRLHNATSAKPQVFVAPIAAGEKVIASRESELFQFLRTSYNDAIAVEMEGYGFLQAAFAYPNIQTLVIRGISDLIEDKNADDPEKGNEENRQERASQNASAFAFEVLSKLEVEDARSAEPEETPIEPNRPSFFAYDDGWVGRERLIQDLSDRIRGNCRLLMLLGITGIGKTALGERLSMEVSDWLGNDWSHYQQENFDDEQQSFDFSSVAARWLEKWGELVTPDDRKDPQRLLSRLLNHMRENRYLVQMDSLENILQGNEEEGWNDFEDEWWLKFFEAYLKADSCKSCVILTSQDLPGKLEEVGTRYQNFWHFEPLGGLDKAEQIALFEKIELDVNPSADGRPYLERIGAAYEGHPLALRVIAGEIKNKLFRGNIVAYWNRYGSEVEEVEKAIAEGQDGKTVGKDQWKLDRFTTTLRRNVRSRLNKTFTRLKEDAKWAYIMLCESSVYRCPVQEDFWLSHLEDWDRNENEQKAALETLRERYLVEESLEDNRCLLRQHNIIRSVSLKHLESLDD